MPDDLATAELELVPATLAHLEAELRGNADFAAAIGAEVPASWPPGEYDEDAQHFILSLAREAGDAGAGWFGWYAVRPADSQRPRTVIGSIGFFGPPADGVVELGYSICEEHRGRGYATQMVVALSRHALADERVTRVIAHTTRQNPASVAVLRKAGFGVDGFADPDEPERLRFTLG